MEIRVEPRSSSNPVGIIVKAAQLRARARPQCMRSLFVFVIVLWTKPHGT